ncbi:hypothetical protein, partial [Aneurinibacillus aneurinilyticus]|uniref:hypothetical protein n=1 Tax=Aneurinibacillus aneurinilyticus TaxID=1391 RepID=UPI003D24951B
AIVSLFASTQMFCGPAWLGQKAALYASVRETNRRPFGHGVVAIYFGLYWIINTLVIYSKNTPLISPILSPERAVTVSPHSLHNYFPVMNRVFVQLYFFRFA